MTIINDIRIKDHYVHNLPENRELLAYARENRRTGNMAEIAFWKQVHKKMFHGLDFDRQKVIGNFIVDNYEHEDYEKKNKDAYITTPPSGTPSKIEGEFARPAQCAVAGNSARTRVLTSPTIRQWQQKAFF